MLCFAPGSLSEEVTTEHVSSLITSVMHLGTFVLSHLSRQSESFKSDCLLCSSVYPGDRDTIRAQLVFVEYFYEKQQKLAL